MQNVKKLVFGAMLCAMALPAAASSVWNFGGTGTSASSGAVGSFTVNNTGGAPSGTVTGNVAAVQGGQTSGSIISSGQLYWYGQSLGIGVEAAPYHAIDNQGAYEFVLLTFSSKVSLNAITVGYNGVDNVTPAGTATAKASVLAFTGSPPVNSVPNITNGNDTWGNLTSAWNNTTNIGGWQSIGTYDTSAGANNTANFTTPVYSSYWLVGAYNPLFGNANAAAPTIPDLFKFVSVSGCAASDTTSAGCTPPSGGATPEPGSLALLGLAMAGMVSLRKRKQK